MTHVHMLDMQYEYPFKGKKKGTLIQMHSPGAMQTH